MPLLLYGQLIDDGPIHSRKRSTISTSAACFTSSITRGTDRLFQLPSTSIPACVTQVLKTRNELLAGTFSTPVSFAIVSRIPLLMTPCSSLILMIFDETFSASVAFSAARTSRPSNLRTQVNHLFRSVTKVRVKPLDPSRQSANLCLQFSRLSLPSTCLLLGLFQTFLALLIHLTKLA